VRLTAALIALAAVAVVAVVAMTITALVARRQGRVVVVDVAWGVALTLTAAAAAAVGAALDEGTPWRAWVLVAAVGVWGLRLSWHIHQRNGGAEDPRYERMLGGPLDEVGMGVAIRKVFLVQGAAVCLVALPVTLGAVTDVEWTPLVAIGLALWVIGVLFEAVGDAQLAAYRRRPRVERPPVLDTGLWRFTRHPNYFGDSCVWWGIWVAGGLASGVTVGLVTVVAPLAMTYFLVFATGARLLEQSMMQRPAYRAYARRTSKFVPLPPRRSTQAPTLDA
jgi:steroid 5-alpha reductase family enzyme